MLVLIFISLGAILGTWIRFIAIKSLENYVFDRKYSVVIVNTFATFILGLFLGLSLRDKFQIEMHPFFLPITVGFLGSLSTFSTFILDLFLIINSRAWKVAFKFIMVSLTSPILAGILGYFFTSE